MDRQVERIAEVVANLGTPVAQVEQAGEGMAESLVHCREIL